MVQHHKSISMKNYKTAPFIVGTMRLGQWGSKMNISEIEKFIEDCIALDLIDFDHADIYGSYTTESDFGAVLKKRPDLRSQMRITTKCGIKMVSENRPEHQIKSYNLTKDHSRSIRTVVLLGAGDGQRGEIIARFDVSESKGHPLPAFAKHITLRGHFFSRFVSGFERFVASGLSF